MLQLDFICVKCFGGHIHFGIHRLDSTRRIIYLLCIGKHSFVKWLNGKKISFFSAVFVVAVSTALGQYYDCLVFPLLIFRKQSRISKIGNLYTVERKKKNFLFARYCYKSNNNKNYGNDNDVVMAFCYLLHPFYATHTHTHTFAFDSLCFSSSFIGQMCARTCC